VTRQLIGAAVTRYVLIPGFMVAALAAVPASAQEFSQAASETHQPKTDVAGAIGDSIKLLMIEHGTRIAFQEKTRRELRGPFWSDYRRSIRWPQTWEDSDSWVVNYLGHPIHGAAAGLIWLDHTGHAASRISLKPSYWASRGWGAAFIAGYSLQFELGPLSEASIGNVGLHPEATGWVDHVVTPVGGFALLVAEDALDRFFVEWVERRTGNAVARAALRMLFGPARTMANLAESRAPWARTTRPLRGR
jgi:hypothetical protein